MRGIWQDSPLLTRGKDGRAARGDYPFEVAIPSGHSVTGVVLADQPRSLSGLERHVDLIDRASTGVLDDVREKIAALIEIP